MHQSESNIGLTLLLILFIGLKLSDVIDWSWWWVLAPLWIPISFALLVFGIIWLVAFRGR